jgi:predicted DNA-binding protein
MKAISFQINRETERQMTQLAAKWGLPSQRHVTAVIERVITTMYLLDIVIAADDEGEEGDR